MSIRDPNQNLPDDRLGTYTPGARVGPDPAASEAAGSSRGSGEAEARSWAQTARVDAPTNTADGTQVTAYGQLVAGASDQVGGGFGGANVGGYGQQGLGSQWGQGGYGPLTQGATYSSGGSRFGPPGFTPYPEGPASGSRRPDAARPESARHGFAPRDPNAPFERPSPTPLFGSARDFGGSAHDHHEPHYRHWRDTKLAGHDEDYARWRDDQARRYDEEYRTWRNAHHTEFSRAFDGWRDQRGPSAVPEAGLPEAGSLSARASHWDKAGADRVVGDPNAVHGANPLLSDIADGGTGSSHRRHETETKVDADEREDGPRGSTR